ncbi:AarF/UbiB family protein [Escherichia coli]
MKTARCSTSGRLPDYCSEGMMVMERIYGIPVSDVAALEKKGTNMKLLAERGGQVFFTQVFRDSFFHADMHPGNIFVAMHTGKPEYIGIDCGIVGSLNKEDKRYLAENFIAFFNRDYRKVAELHVDSGWVPPDTNVGEFEFAIYGL